jgi:hypothetical protein
MSLEETPSARAGTIPQDSDIRCSNQMEDNNQHWTPPEDDLMLGRNASK